MILLRPAAVCAVFTITAIVFCGCEGKDDKDETAVVGYDGLTPVHRAALSGDLTELERLLSILHANPNTRDLAGVMPLHYAARAGHLDAVRMLISYGATPTLQTSTGWSALDLALRENHFETVRFLSQYGFDANGSIPDGEAYLAFAVRVSNVQLAEYLLQYNANANVKMKNGLTVLEASIAAENRELVSLLLAHGARLSHTPQGLNSPLHVVIDWRDMAMVNRMLMAGADPLVPDHNGRTASQHAADLGLTAMAEALANAEATEVSAR